jgi:hypothetical protein
LGTIRRQELSLAGLFSVLSENSPNRLRPQYNKRMVYLAASPHR